MCNGCFLQAQELRRSKVLAFYSIASNTAAAEMAFEMAYNLILKWSLLKNGNSSKHSYSTGVADPLYHLAWEEKREEMTKAREKETEIMAKRLEAVTASERY